MLIARSERIECTRPNGSRILALAAEAFGGYGGIAQSTRDLMGAFALSEAIGTIEILPRHASVPIECLPPGVRQLPPAPGRLAYCARAFQAAASTTPDIVYCGHLFMAPLAAAISRLARARLVVHLHGLELHEPLTRMRKRGLEEADRVLCVSNDTRRRLLATTQVAPDRVDVVYNTYREIFTPRDRAASRLAFGIAREETVLLTVGRLDSRQRHKGHDLVIPLLSDLRAHGRHLLYIIAGDGDDRARLEALADSYGVTAHVRFVGLVPDSQLPDLYRAADLYVMPSSAEGFGISFVEAMACGTPAIGLALGGAPDALCHGDLGVAVAPEEFPAALRASIEGDKPDQFRLAQGVKKRFGREAYQRRVNRTIELLLGVDHRYDHDRQQ